MKRANAGMTLLEMVVSIAVVGVIVIGILNYRGSLGQSTVLSRTVASRDRILSTIRTVSGMATALRNSARASNGTSAVNPQLQACVIGNVTNGCTSGASFGFVLYSPIVGFNGTGTITGVTPITVAGPAPATPVTALPSGFDSFGIPCGPTGGNCPFQIYTTFTAQCAPSPLPSPAPVPIPPSALQPQTTCTVAELINATYVIQLDPNAVTPGMQPIFASPATGTTTTSVQAISGNIPQ